VEDSEAAGEGLAAGLELPTGLNMTEEEVDDDTLGLRSAAEGKVEGNEQGSRGFCSIMGAIVLVSVGLRLPFAARLECRGGGSQ